MKDYSLNLIDKTGSVVKSYSYNYLEAVKYMYSALIQYNGIDTKNLSEVNITFCGEKIATLFR